MYCTYTLAQASGTSGQLPLAAIKANVWEKL